MISKASKPTISYLWDASSEGIAMTDQKETHSKEIAGRRLLDAETGQTAAGEPLITIEQASSKMHDATKENQLASSEVKSLADEFLHFDVALESCW